MFLSGLNIPTVTRQRSKVVERIHHIRAILRQESHLMSKANLRRLKQELKQLEEQKLSEKI